ncbi:MAG: TetM/TetW/TetO/TetS family tetracycline resistance ribosomal protection protein [Lachnospiraceae bacterium]|nr:TetM/TetW/TetO/TetS family tetracycline resistance ribosomal protection protein [Lachnospiraceae bacterium]
MKKLVTGILAHVDAGKTTLSEGLLYQCGAIRRLGRVDNRDAFLDTYELERKRGITIFSKQARLHYEDMEITLLDTPGHVDFSAEMERALQVIDHAVLLISGADGVQGHTRTLWRLLKRYEIPTFLFFNKMDQPGTDKEQLLRECQEKLGENIVDFSGQNMGDFYENIAVCEERLLEEFLETGSIGKEEIAELVAERKLFPCFFGSALKLEGVEELLKALRDYAGGTEAGEEDPFAARVYKISRDRQGNRLTFLKITGGCLKVREEVTGRMSERLTEGMSEDGSSLWREKVTQIRSYSGEKYETVDRADKGGIYAVTGLSYTMPGDGLGVENSSLPPMLEPVLTYKVYLPDDVKPAEALGKLKQLEEEEPELHILWEESIQEIRMQLMGPVQLEVLQSMISERFQMGVTFGPGNIVYRETIANTVEGVGHFEPLRHYAEVQLLMEPGERGSGIQTMSACSEDVLDRNWQRLILTHLEEREHKGVLTGSAITDIKITLTGGKAHLKHTEGGDFRQATYRAVRQGLMQAESVLLEPYYEFTLEIPARMTGRAMTDLERMQAKISAPEMEGDTALLRGQAPAACLQDYQIEVTAYTKGQGHLVCLPAGYAPCHDQEEVIGRIGYDPEADVLNPSSSVFCAHGAGFLVPWYDAPAYMHVESSVKEKPTMEEQIKRLQAAGEERAAADRAIGTEEIDAILAGVSHANSRPQGSGRKWNAKGKAVPAKTLEYREEGTKKPAKSGLKRAEYLLVDGYNIIFAWEELQELAKASIDGARGRLLDILCNYQGMRGIEVIAVFDAYRVKGHDTEMFDYHNIHVVYTKEAETADQYIERFSHENGKKYDITVATSDGLEQIIIRGQGCRLLSARDLKQEIDYYSQNMREDYLERQSVGKRYMLEGMEEKLRENLKE